MKFKNYIIEGTKREKYKGLEKELNKLSSPDGNFSVLNDVKGKFTLNYKSQKDDKRALEKLADKGFKILKKYYPDAKEVESEYGKFPYDPDSYYLEIEYNLGDAARK